MSIYGDGDGGEGLAAPAPAPLAAATSGGGGATSMDGALSKGTGLFDGIVAQFKALPEQTQKLIMGGVVFILILVAWIKVGVWPFNSGGEGPSTIFAGDLPAHANFVAIDTPMTWKDAQKYCLANHAGLASIHSGDDQRAAIDACKEAPLTVDGNPKGCWIGMNDDYMESAFRWADGTPNDFRAFSPGEPNDYGRKHDEFGKNNLGTHTNGVGATAAHGEGYVTMRMSSQTRMGAWNDDPNEGKAGHALNVEDRGTPGREFGYYPLCQAAKPSGLTGAKSWYVPTARRTPDNKFTVVPIQQSWTDARAFCQNNGYADLASVHSLEEHASIVNVCATVANRDNHVGEAQGCWIGMTDRPAEGTQAAEGNWRWSDGSAVNFLAWTPGEPNNWRVSGSASQYHSGVGEGPGAGLGEDVVSITFAASRYPGGWNDEHELGKAGLASEAGVATGACFGCSSRAHGFYTVCESAQPPATLSGAQQLPEWREPVPMPQPLPGAPTPKYVAIPTARSWTDARQECIASNFGHTSEQNRHPSWEAAARYGTRDLASIHSAEDQRLVAQACRDIVCPTSASSGVTPSASGGCSVNTAHGDLMSNGLPHGCWIGMNDEAIEGDFVWSDGSAVNFLHFNPGEPNDWGRATGQGSGSHEGENYVEIDLRSGRSPPGGENANNVGTDAGVAEGEGWNDEHLEGVGAHDVIGSGSVNHDVGCFGCQGTYGMYFVCETAAAVTAPVNPGYSNLPQCSAHPNVAPHPQGTCWKAPYCASNQLSSLGGQVLDDNVKCGFPHDILEENAVQPGCLDPSPATGIGR